MRKARVWIVGGVALLTMAALLVQSIAVASKSQSRRGAPVVERPLPSWIDDGPEFGVQPVKPNDTSDVPSLGRIDPATDGGDPLVFERARFQLNGVALRDVKMGGINLSGIPPGSKIRKAYLYWQWACIEEPMPGFHDTMTFLRGFPRPRTEPAAFVGVLVGSGENPCWCGPSSRNFNYRADVTDVITGEQGGVYGVITMDMAPGSTEYSDPWAYAIFRDCEPQPQALLNGAALLVIYESPCEENGTVVVYDEGIAGHMFTPIPGLSYELVHPAAPGTEARWAAALGDGQVGFGYPEFSGFAIEKTKINGTEIAGPGTDFNDSHLNGSIGKPLPQLFDTAGHDVGEAVNPGSETTTVSFFSESGPGLGDCVVPVVNVLFLR